MAVFRVQCVQHDNSTPIAGLQVQLFRTRLGSLPDSLDDPENWAMEAQSWWPELRAALISTKLTDRRGVCTFEPSPSKLLDRVRNPQNLWYTVEQPSIVGKNQTRLILAVSRVLYPENEDHTVQVRIDSDWLIDRRALPHQQVPFATDNLEAGFALLRNRVTPNRLEDSEPVGEYSRGINQRLRLNAERKREDNFTAHPRTSTPVPIARNIASSESGTAVTFGFDEQESKLFVETSGNESGRRELTFKGVERFTNQSLTSSKRKGLGWTVDPSTGDAKILAPLVPLKLEAAQEIAGIGTVSSSTESED